MTRKPTRPKRLTRLGLTHDEVLDDYRMAVRSRQASLVGRREVMSGKAKFGIFGDGKEIPQVALAHCFRPGDIRSGYYRDQTMVMAAGITQLKPFFAQLYAHADLAHEPATGGRHMNAHFASRLLDDDGRWRDLMAEPTTSSDVSPTGSQMPRLVGLAHASKLYREMGPIPGSERFTHNGDEVAFGTIGNASCAEGMFWEAVNAMGVLGGPMVLSIWDDEFGISVPNRFQVTKENLTALLSGFVREGDSTAGIDLITVRGWDYPALIEAYRQATEVARREHVPQVLHVTELTQPQGHSTSGSHERYKSPERLAWEGEFDGLVQMRKFILDEGIAEPAVLDRIEADETDYVESEREAAWEAFLSPQRAEAIDAVGLLEAFGSELEGGAEASTDGVAALTAKLRNADAPLRRDIASTVEQALVLGRHHSGEARSRLVSWRTAYLATQARRYDSHLYSESAEAALNVATLPPQYAADAPDLFGFEIVNACFDAALGRDPRVVAFGEDLGLLGDVNQGFKGMQEKYGAVRVADTGIRETTILGQAIGLALRGLRPICEMQYLDYVLYALQIMSDDLATLHWRTVGGQKAPVIIRTRGHRLEGIWHSGSPMAGLIHLLRGIHVLVPRDMTRAAAYYNTLLKSDEPALVVEVLNGYRVREKLPSNIGEITLALGEVEVLREGSDVTMVTYGACCRLAMEAATRLAEVGVEVEVIDVQSLLPFDRAGRIAESVRKTGRVVFVDEDVPGGSSAYMLQEVLERQNAYQWLDAAPRTLPAKAHRPSYGSDGDYWSKPSVEDMFLAAYQLLHEDNPAAFPAYWESA